MAAVAPAEKMAGSHAGHGHDADASKRVEDWAAPPEGPASTKNLIIQDVTFGCFTKRNPLRNLAIIFTRSTWVDYFMLGNILFNYGLLAAYDPTWTGPTTIQQTMQNDLENWFQAVFTVEAIIRIFALGAWGENSYFWDPWCCFDFAVVVLCYLVYIPNSGNATALRALRALRPLRSFGLIPSLRKTFNGILAVIGHVIKVEIVDWMLMTIWALVGVQLFAGNMSGGCFFPDPAYPYANGTSPSSYFIAATSNTAGIQAGTAVEALPGMIRNRFINNLLYNADQAWGYCALGRQAFTTTNLPTIQGFGPDPTSCPTTYYSNPLNVTAPAYLVNQTCMEFANALSYNAPQQGLSYDNMGIGFLTTFVAETEEGWTTLNYVLWHTFGANWFVSIYLICLVLFVDDFVSILTDANVWLSYADSLQREKLQDEAAHQPEAVKQSRILERQALDEMFGSMAPKDPAGTERAAIIRNHNMRVGIWNGMVNCWGAIPGPTQATKSFCGRIETMMGFDNFFLAVVFGNIISLACDYYGASDTYNHNLKVANWVFVGLFVVELIVRLGAHGMREFCQDPFNGFDFVIVGISVLEIIVSEAVPGLSSVGISAIRVLRVFRVFRAFKLARGWQKLNQLLGTLTRALPGVCSIFSILFVFILVFAAIGMQIFGGKYKDAILAGKIDEYPRNNYDHFGWAIISVFHIIEGENWFIPLYQHMAVIGPVAALFFIALNVMGNLVFGLVVAVFMQGFDAEEEEEMEHELQQQLEVATAKVEAMLAAGEKIDVPAPGTTTFAIDPVTHRATKLTLELPERGLGVPQGIADAGADDLHFDNRKLGMRVEFTPGWVRCVGVDTKTGKVIDPSRLDSESASFDLSTLDYISPSDMSFFVLSPQNGLRRSLASLVSSSAFEWFSFGITLLSCFNLAFDEPWLITCDSNDSTSACAKMNNYIVYCDAAVVAWLTLEMLLRMLAQGVFGAKHSYLSCNWNICEVIVVVTSIVALGLGEIFGPGQSIKAIRVARALKVVRVLKLVRGLEVLADLSDTLTAMLPAFANAGVLVFLFLYIFAIIGLQSFMGSLNICNDFSVSTSDQCTGNFTLKGPNCAFLPTQYQEDACKAMGNLSTVTFPRQFEAQLPNWNDFGNALLQSYLVSDSENWPQFMYNTVDGGLNQGDPMTRDNDQWKGIFFMLQIVVMDCVVLDLFTGVVRSTYRHIVTKSGGRGYLTNGQRRMVDNTMLVMLSAPFTPPRPPLVGTMAYNAFVNVHAPSFDNIMIALVAMSTLIVGMHRYPEDSLTTARLNGLHYIFVFIFAAETALRFFALGFMQYFRDSWNIFNFCTSVTSIVGAGLVLAAENGSGLRLDYGVMRIALAFMSFRFFAYVRNLRRSSISHLFESVQPIIKAAWFAFPRVCQVLLFYAIIVFSYAVVGMAAFGLMRHGYAGDNQGGNPARSSGNLNIDSNFETFPSAIYNLFRGSTGENWNMLMLDMMQQPPYCNQGSGPNDKTGNCGQPIFSPIYWISFLTCIAMVLDSLLSAVVLESFWKFAEPLDRFSAWHDPAGRRLYTFTFHDSELFVEAWAKIDPYGDAPGATREQLASIFAQLHAPLGCKGTAVAPADFVAALPIDERLAVVPFHIALHAVVNAASSGHAMGQMMLTAAHLDASVLAVRKAASPVEAPARAPVSSTSSESKSDSDSKE